MMKIIGWDFYSRGKNESQDGDYLPLSYKTRLLIPEIDKSILEKYRNT